MARKKLDLKQVTLCHKPEESAEECQVFHAIIDGEVMAVITIEGQTASVHLKYRIPILAIRQLTKRALNMMLRAEHDYRLREVPVRPN
jgi:hypothetical protein